MFLRSMDYRRGEIDLPAESAVAYVARRSEASPHATAVIAGCESLTWAEYGRACAAAERWLERAGLGAGARVAIALGVEPDFLIWAHAVLARGAVVVPIYPNAPAAELCAKVEGAQAVVVVVPAEAAATRRSELRSMGLGIDLVAGNAWRAEAAEGPLRVSAVPAEGGAFLTFTSGSTGEPKGILLSHANMVASRHLFGHATCLGHGDTVLSFLPLAHAYGWMVATATLEAGATLLLQPRYSFAEVVGDVARHRATALFGVSQLIVDLSESDAVAPDSVRSLRFVNTGSAPQAPRIMEAVAERLGVPVTTGYGLTEGAPLTHSSVDRLDLIDVSTVGFPVANTRLRIVDPDDAERPVPPGAAGELVARGPQVCAGYTRPDGAIDRSAWLPDGSFRTGDLVDTDPVGRIRIVGRLKNMIKYKGYSIAPPELEALLALHPNIADCAVLGRGDPMVGEVPTAFIVPRDRAAASSEGIMAFMRSRVSSQKIARDIVFVDVIPRSAAGKVIAPELLRQCERVSHD